MKSDMQPGMPRTNQKSRAMPQSGMAQRYAMPDSGMQSQGIQPQGMPMMQPQQGQKAVAQDPRMLAQMLRGRNPRQDY